MEFEEWWDKEVEGLIKPVPWAKDAWNAATAQADIDKAALVEGLLKAAERLAWHESRAPIHTDEYKIYRALAAKHREDKQ